MSDAVFGLSLGLICAINEGFAQLALKLSVGAGIFRFLWIAGAVLLFVLDAFLYSTALRFLNVNVAFSLGALAMVSIVALSRWVLGEQITRIRWVGIALIVGGTSLIASQV
jgi:multidrug transporter EmrE-like cation transporter